MKYRNTTHIEAGSKKAFWFGLVFGIIGGLAAVFGLLMLFKGIQYQTTGIAAKGYVQQVNFKYGRDKDGDKVKKYTSIVSFYDKSGRQHQVTFKKKLTENSAVSLLYLADKPDAAKIDSTTNMIFGPIFLMLMGAGFAAIGIWISISSKKRQEEIAWLTSRGHRITAEIIGIKENSRSYRSSSRSRTRRTYQIVARHYDYKDTFISESDPHMFDETNIGKNVTIFLNPQNPKSYFVDLNSIGRI